MNDIKYSTKEEERLFCSTQTAIGALANGYIGTDTMILINHKLGGGGFPHTVRMYGWPTIVGEHILPFTPGGKSPLKNYANSMLGSIDVGGSQYFSNTITNNLYTNKGQMTTGHVYTFDVTVTITSLS